MKPKTPKVHVFGKLYNSMEYPMATNVRKNLEKIKEMAEIIKSRYLKTVIDTVVIVGTGSSGAIVASQIILHLNDDRVSMVHIKKEGENSHSSKVTSNWTIQNGRYIIFVDDFMCTGETFNRMYDAIKEYLPRRNKGYIDALCFSGAVQNHRVMIPVKEIFCGCEKP